MRLKVGVDGKTIAFEVEPTGALGAYSVALDGRPLGEVYKWERRYNLRRLYVTRGWKAKPKDSPRPALPHADGCYDTRAAAIVALHAATKTVRFVADDEYGAWRAGDEAVDLGCEAGYIQGDELNIRLLLLGDGQTYSISNAFERGLVEPVVCAVVGPLA